MRRLPYFAALTIGLLAVPSVTALGQSNEKTSISIQVERSTLPELPDSVAARLLTESGEPISGAEIELWIEVEILGYRSALLGTATTDATGVARVPITPRHLDYQIRARYGGEDPYEAAEATATLSFPADRVDPVEVVAPNSLLASLRSVMPRAMGIVVALLWVFFAAAVFHVIKTIKKQRGEDPAQF